MLLTGIIGKESGAKTTSLIISMFSLNSKKVDVIDSEFLSDFSLESFENYLRKLSETDADVIIFKINSDFIKKEFYKKLNFDIIIYQDKADDLFVGKIEEYKKIMKKIFLLLNKRGVAIVNIDDYALASFLHGMKYYVITYGFNKKASITASSIGDTLYNNDFMCCQQRVLLTRDGHEIEPQEYKINIDSKEVDPYSVLAATTFAIINNVDVGGATFTPYIS